MEDLLALVKENGIEITEEQAKALFDQLHATGELSDDELDKVAEASRMRSGRSISNLNFDPAA